MLTHGLSRHLGAALAVTLVCAANAAWHELPRAQLLLGAVLFSAAWGGRGPGLTAIALAAVAEWIGPGAPADVFPRVVFVAEGATLVAVIASLRAARVRAERLCATAVGETRTVREHVTALRTMQEALAASERKYRRLFEGSPDAVLVVANSAIVDANPAAVTLLGYDITELLTRTVDALLVDPHDAATLSSAPVDGCERLMKFRRKDGIAVHTRIAPGAGVAEGTTAIMIHDLSATLSLERQMRQAQKMEAVGRLASGVAHDFNNLLTAITGYAELLISGMSPTDPKIQDAYEIRRAGLSAARLTRQLLAFGRQQRAHTEVVDLNAVVAQAAGILKRTLGENIRVTLQLDPDLDRVKADVTHLEQIVLNLAVNARDAMPDGGELTVATTMHHGRGDDPRRAEPRDYVRLTLADTGCGIPEPLQSKVFEPFFTTKGKGGTGLGLATVYGIVKQAGGEIRFESVEGRGTTFTIDLPSTTETARARDVSAQPPCFIEGCGTVLVVDDDQRIREITELVLRRAGHDVILAGSPHEALTAIRDRDDVNILLTDVVMPDMTGYDLAEEARKVSPGLRCVFMSGFACDQFRGATTETFLPKPFTIESLTSAVQQAIAAA